MNPEAVTWLEGLTGDEHAKMFTPVIPFTADLFSLKEDHERCGLCPIALRSGELLVIE